MRWTTFFKTLYLVFYNAAQSIGWAYGFMLTVQTLIQTGRWETVFRSASPVIAVCQLASALEILHAATGLVRTSAANAALQWAGRWHVYLVVKYIAPPIQLEPAVSTLFLAWSLSEMIRYPQYTLSLLGSCPKWLEWLRYSAFIPLYPIGVTSEIWLLYQAIDYARALTSFELRIPIMGIPFVLRYSAFLFFLIWIYPALWWKLYSYMLAQRSKKLGGEKADAKVTVKESKAETKKKKK